MSTEKEDREQAIDTILFGIDKDHCMDAEGWWETSTGVAFGASKLAEVKAYIESALAQAATDKVDARRLRAFALEIMECWPEGDVDGGYLQELAAKHGLIKAVLATEACNKDTEGNCHCAEYHGEFPVECFRYTELLTIDAALTGTKP